jgi:hypothetical protein
MNFQLSVPLTEPQQSSAYKTLYVRELKLDNVCLFFKEQDRRYAELLQTRRSDANKDILTICMFYKTRQTIWISC